MANKPINYDTYIRFKLPTELKEQFLEAIKQKYPDFPPDMSVVLRDLIQVFINKTKQGN
jgi:hypothetical protein